MMDPKYPVQTIVLANGSRIRVRPIRPDDAPRLQAFATRLSARTLFLRTNMVRPASLTDAEAAAATDIDFRSKMALIAVTGVDPHEKIVAVARYCTAKPHNREAEVGIVVEDAYQGQGIGWQLLQRLAAYGRGQGLHSMVATVARDNAGVQGMIRRAGFPAEYTDTGCGEYQVTASIKGGPRANVSLGSMGGGLFAAFRRRFR